MRIRRGEEAKRAHFEGKFQRLKDIGDAMCPTYGKLHRGPCLKDINTCFHCGEEGYKRKYCPRTQGKGKDIYPQGGAPRDNRIYGLQGRQ